MDKQTLYEKAEKAFNQAFEVAKQSAKVLGEKAGEAAHITKLMIEKAGLEHKVTKQFAQLGSRVYERASRSEGSLDLDDQVITDLIQETKELEGQLGKIEAALEAERSKKAKN
ncbi:MAG: hypothetical protein H6757_04810 [Candidatus Omnitrophica bacterium]|nr:hypothetical protein [Candidatus Omnitrophota bacterium]